jgi:hypothetical protein
MGLKVFFVGERNEKHHIPHETHNCDILSWNLDKNVQLYNIDG